MYETETFENFNSINLKTLRYFIISDLNEIKYFNCNVDNLVSLRDYLLQLNEVNNNKNSVKNMQFSSVVLY